MQLSKFIHTCFILGLALLTVLPLRAQDREVLHSTLFGGGSANILDTYLAPYNHTGLDLRIIRETSRMTSLLDGNVMVQTLTTLHGSYTKNPAGNIHDWEGGLQYSIYWQYRFRPLIDDDRNHLTLLAGCGPTAYAGGIYNTLGSNNPAQAKASIMADLTAQVLYSRRIGKHDYTLRYQLSLPFLGAAFSPQYGQSYYEAFILHHYDHNILFAHPFNTPSLRHLLTLDIPLHGGQTLRLGYNGEFLQSRYNNLHHHQYSHDFVIGWSKTFIRK